MGLRELIRAMLEKQGELPGPSGSRVPDKSHEPAVGGDTSQRANLHAPAFAALEIGGPEPEGRSVPVPRQPVQEQPPYQDADGGSEGRPAAQGDVTTAGLRLDPEGELPSVPAPPHAHMSGRWSALQNEDASPGSFLWQARQNVAHTRDAGVHVPLQSYWTTYDHLDHGQADWYYFWRTRLRAGEALPTDLSYLFLHVYEVLNGVGFETAGEAFAHLHNLWRVYREAHPTLDRYLMPWLTDFVHYHRLTNAAAQNWLTESRRYGEGDLGLTHWVQHGDHRSMPETIFKHLVGTAFKRNKFYREHLNQAELDDLFRRALLLTDDFYTVETGQSVYLHLAPEQTQQVMRRTFENAAFEHPTFWYPAGPLRPYSEDGRLAKLFTQVVRYTENGARAQMGFKPLLQDAGIHPPLMDYLNSHLFAPDQQEAAPRPSARRQREEQAMRRYLEEQQRRDGARPQSSPPAAAQNTVRTLPPAEQQRRTVALDVGRLAALRQESEELRARLLEEHDGPGEDVEVPGIILGTNPAPIPVPASKPGERRVVALDLQRLAELQKASEEIRGRLLAEDSGHVTDPEVHAVPNTQSLPVPAISVPNEIHIVMPDVIPEGELTDVVAIACALRAITPAALHLLRQLRTQHWDTPEDRLLVPEGVFASALVDEINEAAQNELGDVLLMQSGPLLSVLEDYRDELELLLGGPAVSSQPSIAAQPEPGGDWIRFSAALEPLHVTVLAQLIHRDLSLRELETIAAAQHALASVVLESLNTHALATIGDILINPYADPLTLEDFHRPGVLRVLRAWGAIN